MGELICVGAVVGAFGIKGEVRLKSFTSIPETIADYAPLLTEKGEEKFTEQIADTHTLFKNFVSSQRPSLDIGKVATGEYWFGIKAHELGLADKVSTSDEYLLEKHVNNSSILKVKFEQKKGLKEKLGLAASNALHQSLLKVWQSLENRKYL